MLGFEDSGSSIRSLRRRDPCSVERGALAAGASSAFGRHAMEKYGVVVHDDVKITDNVKVKVGAPKKKEPDYCPTCGAALDGPHHCPLHGTEPFEKKP
jgi:hypothetical protein